MNISIMMAWTVGATAFANRVRERRECERALAYAGDENHVTIRNGTVADIPDAELLRRVVRSRALCKPGRHARWVFVMDAFGLGSTYAAQLCRRFGLDPDQSRTPRNAADG